jgi:hypothetical protein
MVGGAFASLIAGGTATAAATATATAVVSAVYTGAIYGAVIGAATSALTGGDILQGALKGAIIGGITGGIAKGFSIASSGGVGSGGGLAGTPGNIGESALKTTGEVASSAQSVPSGLLEPGVAADALGNTAESFNLATNVVEKTPELLQKGVNFIESRPNVGLLAGQTLSGIAQGAMEGEAANDQLALAMERDRLARDARKIKGITDLNLEPGRPTVMGFKSPTIYKYDPETGGLVKVGA